MGHADREGVRGRSADLPPLWIRDEAHSDHHQSFRSGHDPASPSQDRKGTAGTRSPLPGLITCTIPRSATAGTMPSDKELLSTVAHPAGLHWSTQGRPSSKPRPKYFDHAR
jgi:hypothetical protein